MYATYVYWLVPKAGVPGIYQAIVGRVLLFGGGNSNCVKPFSPAFGRETDYPDVSVSLAPELLKVIY